MFCIECGEKFESASKVRSIYLFYREQTRCSFCAQKPYQSFPHGRKRYCLLCRDVREPRTGMACTGEPALFTQSRALCHRCRSFQDMAQALKSPRYLTEVKALDTPELKKLKHECRANTPKDREDLIILKECSCPTNGRAKDRHHPNYRKPNEVMILCPSCHFKEAAKEDKNLYLNWWLTQHARVFGNQQAPTLQLP